MQLVLQINFVLGNLQNLIQWDFVMPWYKPHKINNKCLPSFIFKIKVPHFHYINKKLYIGNHRIINFLKMLINNQTIITEIQMW